jgi:hypothetical protein
LAHRTTDALVTLIVPLKSDAYLLYLSFTWKMKLTFVNDLGQAFSLEIDSDMELENVMALLEAEVRLPR